MTRRESGQFLLCVMTVIISTASLTFLGSAGIYSVGEVETLLSGPNSPEEETRSTRSAVGEEIYYDELGTLIGWEYTVNSNKNSSVYSDGSHMSVSNYGDSRLGYWGPIVEKELPEQISTKEDFIIDIRFYIEADHTNYGIRARLDLMDENNNTAAWMEYKDEKIVSYNGKAYINAEDKRIWEREDYYLGPLNFDHRLSIARNGTKWYAYFDKDLMSSLNVEPHYNCTKIRVTFQKVNDLLAREPHLDYIKIKKGNLLPEVPENFEGTLFRDEGRVSLSWSPSSEINYDGFRIYRSEGDAGFLHIATIDRSKFSYEDLLPSKGNYSYRMTAYNTFIQSNFSEALKFDYTTVPSEPRNFTIDPNTENIVVRWMEPDDDGGIDLTEYTLYRRNSTGGEFVLSRFQAGNVSYLYTDENVSLGWTYTYYLTAANELGESPKGEGKEIIYIFPSSAPLNLTLEYGMNQVNLTWEPPSFLGGSTDFEYKVHRNTSFSNEEIIATLSHQHMEYLDRHVPENGTYRYFVTVVNEAGESPPSNEASVYVQICYFRPDPPVDLVLEFVNDTVIIAWGNPPRSGGMAIEEYRIYRGIETGDLDLLASVPASNTTHTDPDIINNRTYYYAVTAVNQVGESNRSVEASILVRITTFTPPDPPTNLRLEFASNQVMITWDAPLKQGGSPVVEYRIYRRVEDGEWSRISTAGHLERKHIDADLANLTTYSYRLTAVNAIGESEPGPSEEIYVILKGWNGTSPDDDDDIDDDTSDDDQDDDTADDDDGKDGGDNTLLVAIAIILAIVAFAAIIGLIMMMVRNREDEEE
ncbi:MAG: fibronectin type III domain-containing protein [Thermoplasmatota archaeon]